MESTPIKQEDMEFDAEHEVIVKQEEEPDHELLQLQKRKSTPKVVIQEYIDGSSDEGSLSENDDLVGNSPVGKKRGSTHKLKTHHTIDDVSNIFFKFKFISH